MTFMQWSDALSVGIDEIDQQHHWLIDTTNRLHDALTSGAGQADRAAIGSIVHGLIDYTINHFVAEEVLFKQYHYPQEAQHTAQHNALTRQVMDVLHAFENGADVGLETLDLLKNWLQNHIMKSDQMYADFIRSQTAPAPVSAPRP